MSGVDLQGQTGSLRAELHNEIGGLRADLQGQIGSLRAELHKEIGNVQEKIGEIHQKMAAQTRWLVTAILANATVLIPVMQKVLEERTDKGGQIREPQRRVLFP